MDARDFIIGTGAYACSMYLKAKADLSEKPSGDDPVVPVPPNK
jgi:hypothetical protein